MVSKESVINKVTFHSKRRLLSQMIFTKDITQWPFTNVDNSSKIDDLIHVQPLQHLVVLKIFFFFWTLITSKYLYFGSTEIRCVGFFLGRFGCLMFGWSSEKVTMNEVMKFVWSNICSLKRLRNFLKICQLNWFQKRSF